MERASITKKVTIELDIITGNVDVVDEGMSYHELLGALEMAKAIVMRDLIREME